MDGARPAETKTPQPRRSRTRLLILLFIILGMATVVLSLVADVLYGLSTPD